MVFILVEPTFEGNQGTEMTKLEGELCYKNCFIAAVKEFIWKHDTQSFSALKYVPHLNIWLQNWNSGAEVYMLQDITSELNVNRKTFFSLRGT